MSVTTHDTHEKADPSQAAGDGDPPVLSALAAFATSIGEASVPARVREQAALCLLDTLGCMIAGSVLPEVGQLIAAEGALSASETALSVPAQARVLGYAGDVLELNDLVGGHASIGTVAATVSAARGRGVSGTELLDAIVAGDEVTARLYEASAWTRKPYTESGIVIPSLISSIGAAAAVARLHDLPVDLAAEAMAIAGTIASWGPAEVVFGTGGTIKPMLFGAAPAASAIQAVAYARHGITGPLRLVESPIGLMTATAANYDLDKLYDTKSWYLLQPQRKLHASCGYTHSSIDAVAGLVRQGVPVATAERIEVQLPEYLLAAVRKEQPPRTPNEARFHLQYCVALAASGVDVIGPEHTVEFARHSALPEIESLVSRIAVVPLDVTSSIHSKPYNVSHVVVTHADGSVTEGGCEAPRGSSGNPLSDHDVIAKFRRVAAARLSASAVDDCVEAVLHLDEQSDIAWLGDLVGLILGE
ncbi:MAG: MmgE/PrpD family protein [Actinobacteria bacterium]|uniref:MmgE/PrpD family protein n=1 Tax=Microbacterium sp. NPDC076895 TaxID=3154957 RepID=UPI0010013AB5|nr:MAG: MmgE/PrpD family protein [Actinomycetota bacterium]